MDRDPEGDQLVASIYLALATFAIQSGLTEIERCLRQARLHWYELHGADLKFGLRRRKTHLTRENATVYLLRNS